MERTFQKISALEKANLSLLFAYFQSCAEALSTFRKLYHTIKPLVAEFGENEFSFEEATFIFPQRSESALRALQAMADNRLTLKRMRIEVAKELVNVDFSFQMSKTTAEETRRVEDFADALFSVIRVIDNPICLYSMNKALSLGRILTQTISDELGNFIAADRLELGAQISHNLNNMVEARIIRKFDRGIYIPGQNYDMAIEIFSQMIAFYENQWKDYSQRSVSEAMNISNLKIQSADRISSVLPTVLKLIMFMRNRRYYRIGDFPIIALEGDEPIGYVSFDDVAEGALRSTLTDFTDERLNSEVKDSNLLVIVAPLDPKTKLRDAWPRFMEKPIEFVPSSKDGNLGYMSGKEIRFFPVIS